MAAQPNVIPYVEEPAQYVFTRQLSANQKLIDLSKLIERDSDFLWTKIWGTSTGLYSVAFKMANGRYISDAPIRSVNIIGTAQFPVAIGPPLRYAAGSRISIDITNLTGATNDIELIFGGVRRYATR